VTKRLSFILVLVFSFSCATDRPSGKTEAEALYKEALGLVEEGHYQFAQERLNEIKSKYPYSFYATHAELLAADILYKQESFVEAASAYTLFKDFHPKHEKIDYVIWRVAESYNEQIPTFDRDLTPAFQAIKYYREVISRFPKSKYIKNAREKIDFAEEKIRAKEQYIADFYFKTKEYSAAEYRYRDILKTFHRPKSFIDHAKVRLVKSAYNQKKIDECKKYFKSYYPSLDAESQEMINQLEECK